MERFYTTYMVSAFSDRPFMGNATGVVIDDWQLTDEEMQNIARDYNQSVMVFVKRLDIGRYSTRFFTPFEEIKLCGHATIATFYALAENEYITPLENGVKKVIQHTKIDKIPVELEYKNDKVRNIYMNLKLKEVKEIEDNEIIDRIINILGIKKEDIGLSIAEDAKIEMISTGAKDIIVPVKNYEILSKINLDEKKALLITEEQDCISIHAFTTEDGKNINQRTFSPRIRVREEVGSGTSTAATMYYLYRNKINEGKSIVSTQGTVLGRKSKVVAEMNADENCVRVGGRAYVFMNGVLKI
ncbi:PhzF family phenazine biosynthesis protein [Peptoniphilus olsenii]|uniref:PhzF family phenazine biosynthesis protein n=2 Tax=Peptoniphilus olsenii TaxID=411570 RepID=A0ABV2JD75_9FIRM